MPKQTINRGTGELSGDGESIREAFRKTNENFTELYGQLGAVDQHILPATDVTYDLGSTTKRFRTLYLSGNTIDLGGSLISAALDGNIAIPGVSILYYVPDNIVDGGLTNPPADWDEFGLGPYEPAYYPDTPVIIDQFTYFLANQSDEGSLAARASYVPTVYTPTMTLGENGFTIASIAITTPGSYDPSNSSFINIETVNTDNMWALPRSTDINDWNALAAAIADVDSYAGPIAAGVNMVASTSAVVGLSNYALSSTIPADVSDLTDTGNLLFDGDYTSLSNKPSIPPNDVDVGGTKYRLIAGDSIELVSASANYFVRVSEGGVGLTTGTLVSGPITILNSASTGVNGSLTFPDATVQTTAWVGIPGPYADDAAAAIANVAIGSPYYQVSGQVFVRLV